MPMDKKCVWNSADFLYTALVFSNEVEYYLGSISIALSIP